MHHNGELPRDGHSIDVDRDGLSTDEFPPFPFAGDMNGRTLRTAFSYATQLPRREMQVPIYV
jgi:hypothetical protein